MNSLYDPMDVSENKRCVERTTKEFEFKEFLKNNLRITLGRSDGYIEVKLLLKDGKDWSTISDDSYYVGQND